MANNSTSSDPIVPLSVMVDFFVAQTRNDIKFNFIKQQVFPTEIYPGYNEINAKRKAAHRWFSTGEGEKTLTVEAHAKDDPQNMHVDFEFNDYLTYVDIGVGGHTKASQVIEQRKQSLIRDISTIGFVQTESHIAQSSCVQCLDFVNDLLATLKNIMAIVEKFLFCIHTKDSRK